MFQQTKSRFERKHKILLAGTWQTWFGKLKENKPARLNSDDTFAYCSFYYLSYVADAPCSQVRRRDTARVPTQQSRSKT